MASERGFLACKTRIFKCDGLCCFGLLEGDALENSLFWENILMIFARCFFIFFSRILK